jgi:hypothetical protein
MPSIPFLMRCFRVVLFCIPTVGPASSLFVVPMLASAIRSEPNLVFDASQALLKVRVSMSTCVPSQWVLDESDDDDVPPPLGPSQAVATSAWELSEDSSADDGGADDCVRAAELPRRGRGRPRKVVAENAAPPVKRPRGRPRKADTQAAETVVASLSLSVGFNSLAALGECPVRDVASLLCMPPPRKIKPTTANAVQLCFGSKPRPAQSLSCEAAHLGTGRHQAKQLVTDMGICAYHTVRH